MSSCVKVLLCFCVLSVGCYKTGEGITKEPFQLDEILDSTFPLQGFNGTWISDTEFIYNNLDGDVVKYDMLGKGAEIFLTAAVLAKYQPAIITLSNDRLYVLIRYNESAVFRHSITAFYTIYDISNGQYYDIGFNKALQLASFAPEGHGLAYVYENNIYYLDDFSVDVNNPIAVTNIGVPGITYCGVPDWVYEEEVLASGSALWFSPSGNHMAYAVFADEKVKTYSYFIYGEPGSLEYQYQKNATIKYPKVGTTNPTVITYLYDIQNQQTLEFQLPFSIDNKSENDYILYDVAWVSEQEVAMVSTNRVQNESRIIRCRINGECQEEVNYSESNGWLEPLIPKYSKDGTKRLEILPQIEGDDKFNHLVLTDVAADSIIRLTSGRFVVISILAWDEDSGLIYYTASVENKPSQQHVYVVSVEGPIQCLTCSMKIDDQQCIYGDGLFSKNNSYYVKQCSGPGPALTLIENAKNPGDFTVWQDNAEVRRALTSKLFPKIRDFEVPLTDKFIARARLLLPPDLDENSTKKYPAVINVYGGPNQNQILDSFRIKFEHYITTNRKYIYIFIDGRGSGRDGQNKLFEMYRQFGTVEIEDQITVMKYLLNNLSYIDENRVGIWGWSYGGFASSWALVKDAGHIFNFALAVAPVTDFIYYDSIYTERYMGLPTPEDNEYGYNNTDLTRRVESFRGRRYFIIHGNADDNVHYQNSQLLIKALEYADIDFRQQNYPDEQHSLAHVSRHLYHTIDKYWASCFSDAGSAITSFNN